MSNPSSLIVEGYRYKGRDLDLSGADFLSLALDQRAFGRHQLVVVTARPDGTMLGLAHCGQTEPPEIGLKCCLDLLGDGAAAAIAYSDEPVSTDPPNDLRHRLDTARVAAQELGVNLVDWVMCGDNELRSMRFTLGEGEYEWDTADTVGRPPVKASHRASSKNRPRRKPRRSRRQRRRGR